jgi:two-component system NarL family sensor kinase
MTATDRARTRSRAAVTAAWLLAAAASLAGPLAVVVAATADEPFVPELLVSPEAVVGPSFTVVGALLVRLPAARRIGWLMVTVGATSATYALSFALAARALGLDGEVLRDGPADGTVHGALALAVWLGTWTWIPSFLLVTVVLPQVVPYGRPLPGAGWRALLVGSLLLAGVTTTLVALLPGETDNFPGVDNPLGAQALHGVRHVGVSADVTFLVFVAAGLASLVLRVARAGSVERRQLGWIGLGIVAVLVSIMLAPWWFVDGAVLFVPAGIALSAYRYRLYDVDLIVNRALVAGLLLGGAALIYVALVGWIGALVDTTGATVSFAAAFGVALLFHPARIAVQRGVDRLLYGQRGDPTALLAHLDDVVRSASSPRAALQAAVETVAVALKLPHVAVEVPPRAGDVVRLSAGEPPSHRELHAVDLDLHGERVGRLLAAPRSGSDRLGRADQHALGAIAGPLASAAFALRLTGDLEESRGRLVSAAEEERRRLRRDLHDGLGPQLSGVVMGLDTALAALRRGDAQRATDLVTAATGQAQEAVQDVRRLVHGLRPPALDDLGLVGALEALGERLREGGPAIAVVCGGSTIDLPAAVEVAVFRIAQESLTNAVRHAGAAHVELSLTVEDRTVVLDVSDDGCGLQPSRVAGVGLASMRERAAEVGGSVEIGTAVPHGTRVTARLPVSPAPAQPLAGLPGPRGSS